MRRRRGRRGSTLRTLVGRRRNPIHQREIHQLRAVARDRARLHFSFERKAKARLRIGYLSDDFREHAVACLIAEMIELHDRERFAIVAYSYGTDDASAMRAVQRANPLPPPPATVKEMALTKGFTIDFVVR